MSSRPGSVARAGRAAGRALACWLLACGLSVVCLLALPGAAQAQQQPLPQQGVLVVQLPFTGDASDALLHDAEDSVRQALLARGATGPDRPTVAAAMPASAPSDTQSIVEFGRSMGGTHVVTGQVTPLTGQYNLRLRLYEVSTGRVAEQYRNLGEGDSDPVIAQMVAALFAPGALQLSPEERARQEEERRRQEEERRRQEEARRRDEARRREEEARRRREEAERNRRIYRVGEGGLVSLGAAGVVGGRVTPGLTRPMGFPQPNDGLWGGLRFEGGYTVLPAPVGIELGGAAMIVFAPTSAFTIGPAARFALPARGPVPLRGSVGVALGLFQGVTGARSTGFWTNADVRVEWDIVPALTVFGGLNMDLVAGLYGPQPSGSQVPGAFVALGGILGLRIHFGTPSPGCARAADCANGGNGNGNGAGQGAGAGANSGQDTSAMPTMGGSTGP